MPNEQVLGAPRASAFNLRPILLLFGIAAAVAAGVGVMLWWQGPNWSVLYGNLEAADASQVVQALQTAGIKYKLNDGNGAVMVSADQVREARLKLASQGLPEGNSSGLDMISKDSGIGVSQFMETARYQYALETELARTIATIKSVVAARVHLAITQQSAFVRDRHPASASVLLQLRPGGRLEPDQVQAIVHLVASSIPDLTADQVTLVDQQGRLLTAVGSPLATIQSERFAAAQRIEDGYAQRVEALLVPLFGPGRVRAEVTVDLDANENEESHEQYKPDSAVVRSEQTAESTAPAAAAGVGGVPGALSNQPPAGGSVAAAAPKPAATAAGGPAGAAGPAAAGAAGAAGTESVSKQATRNFEIDRTLSYTRQPGGRIKRLTVAVLVDNQTRTATDGKTSTQALSSKQIDDITLLVKNTVGFDESRGDAVSVVNEAFHEEAASVAPDPIPIWQRPMVQDIARLALGALILLAIALGVLRPMIRSLTATAVPVLVTAQAGGQPAVSGEVVAGPAGAAAPLAYEQQIVQAKNLVAQDPKRVAQVVKTWVGE